MENNNNPDYAYQNVVQINDADASRKYLANVFLWMFGALAISAIFAYEFFMTPSLLGLIVQPTVNGGLAYTGLGYVAVFSPLIFSLVLSFGFNRISYPMMVFLFLAYAVMIGISFSVLGIIYTSSSIFGVFLSSSVVFGIMAIAGYTTNMDLSKFGSILMMIFFAAFAVSFINFFLGSAQLQYIISFVFVIIMIGLTAYYMQMLKRIGAGLEYGAEESKKLVVIGAFILYTTFINLFISMLRIFGRRS